MKKWTEAYIKDANIIDADEFNKAYNAHKSSLNGGLDRDVLQSRTFQDEAFSDNAFHSMVLKNNERNMNNCFIFNK